jgi:hypothetical protein
LSATVEEIVELYNELQKELWSLLDQSRNSYNIGDFEIFEQWITSADTEQLELRLSVWNDVMKNNWRQNQGEFISKPDVAEFIIQLIGNNTYNRVLDPACGIGYLLSKVASSCEAKDIDGIEINQKIYDTALKLHDNLSITHSDSCSTDLSANEYDLIISELPLGVKVPPFTSDWLDIRITEASLGIMTNCLKHLSTNGTAIFSCLESIFWTVNGLKFIQSLREREYYVNAVFQQQNSRLNTSVATCLLQISKRKSEKIFVAKCSDDKDANENIISNYQNNLSNDRVPANGILIEHDLFRGFDALQATAKITKIAKNRGYNIHNYQDVVETQKIYDLKKIDEIEALPNSIFFNMIFPKKIYLTVDEFDRKSGKICNIQFKEDIIKASTLKSLYCQDILDSLFSQIAFGNTHKHVSINNLSRMKIIAPAKNQAIESENFLRKVTDAKLRLDDLESVVRNDFLKSKNEITVLDNFGNFSSWIETLPFPLATLLKKFTVEENSNNKSKILIEFFENLAALIGIIHLSARWRDLEGDSELKTNLSNQLKDNGLSFYNATFGLWRTIIDTISTNSATIYKDPETKSLITQKYCTSNSEILNFLCGKACRRIIGKANTFRNDKDHNRKSGNELLECLTDLVDEFRQEIGRSFSNYELISPVGGLYENGLFKCNSRVLNGHSVIWASKNYTTSTPLESNQLYLHSKFDNMSLKLLPLIVLRSTPSSEKNAIYMHNKIKNEQQLLVAHHLTDDKLLEENLHEVEYVISEFSIE